MGFAESMGMESMEGKRRTKREASQVCADTDCSSRPILVALT